MARGKMPSVDTSRYAMVPRNDVPRSSFTMQFGHKTTFNGNFLVPVYVEEVLPGDSLRLKMAAFCRLSTPLVPVLDNMYMETFFFFVPYRLVWEHWTAFMGEQAYPEDTTAYTVPQMPLDNSNMNLGAGGSIFDYMGITLNNNVANSISVSALPFRAYNLIYNEWFRDEDLIIPQIVPTGDGPDNPLLFGLRVRGKRHDYFTSARPWPQKPINMSAMFGTSTVPNPAATLIRGGNMLFPQSGAPVSGIGPNSGSSPTAGPVSIAETGGRTVEYATYYTGGTRLEAQPGATGFPNVRVLINDIRTANVVQFMMERNSRGGTRYTEILRSHFGVASPDSRLQRPEYLGGGRTPISINPVAQTSATGVAGTTTVLGELAGVGTALTHNNGFSTSFVEHGVVLGIVNVRADMSYQNGIERFWFRRSQYDFYWPGLAHLGEQAIIAREIFADGSSADGAVFGYQERWAEYKSRNSRISGLFRSAYPGGSLDFWHLGTYYASHPGLNNAFINADTPFERALQVETTGNDQFLLDTFCDARWARCMPVYSIPGLGPRL